MKCEKCGKELYGSRTMCIECETSVVMEGLNVGMKNPGFAALFSLFIPGAGQVYLGEKTRGITFFIATTLAVYTIFITWFGFLLFIGIWLYNVYDAMMTGRAKIMKRKQISN